MWERPLVRISLSRSVLLRRALQARWEGPPLRTSALILRRQLTITAITQFITCLAPRRLSTGTMDTWTVPDDAEFSGPPGPRTSARVDADHAAFVGKHVGENRSVVSETSGLGFDREMHDWLVNKGVLPATPSAQTGTPAPAWPVTPVPDSPPEPEAELPSSSTQNSQIPTLQAAAYIGTLVASSTAIDASAITDQVVELLGVVPSDQISRRTVYRMTVAAIATERSVQQRLAEMTQVSAVLDPTGGFAIANILVDIAARRSRPYPVSDEPIMVEVRPSLNCPINCSILSEH